MFTAKANILTGVFFLLRLVCLSHGFRIRLVNITTGHPVSGKEGNLQVFVDGRWNFLSATGLNAAKSHAACRQLQFLKASEYRSPSNQTEVAGIVVLFENLKCLGKRMKLSDCTYDGYKYVNNSDNYLLSWIECEPVPEPVRECGYKEIKLTLLKNLHSGNVQIKHEGKWKKLRVKNWDVDCGKQACLQLGFPGLVKNLLFHEIYDIMGNESFVCKGNQAGLTCCPVSEHKKEKAYEVGVVCEPALRLVDLKRSNHGAIQIYRNKKWHYMCGEKWTEDETRVVCRQLGYNRDNDVRHYLVPSTQKNNIWHNDTSCKGTEKYLEDCTSGLRPRSKCEEIVYVVCEGKNISLVGLSSPLAGRVEVLYKGIWGAVIETDQNYNFGAKEARVVCRELGYHDAVRVLNYKEVPLIASKLVWLSRIRCKGNEKLLRHCSFEMYSTMKDSYFHVGVLCKLNMRLTSNDGSLQVFNHNSWKFVCSTQWTINDAKDVCRYLGYRTATETNYVTLTSHSNLDFLKFNRKCRKKDESYSECFEKSMEGSCNGGPVSTKCKGKEGDLRLIEFVSDDDSVVGELQIRHQGTWGLISGYKWTMKNAQVVCRQMNTPGVKQFKLFKQSKTSDGRLFWLRGVYCKGDEKRLVECPRDPWIVSRTEADKISRYKKASIECEKDIRLTGGKKPNEGTVERYRAGNWEPVCANQKIQKLSIRRFCQELGYVGGKEISVSRDKDDAVTCKRGTKLHVQCFESKYRLKNNGGPSYSGSVEVLYKNRWFRFFAFPPWNNSQGGPLCRILGFPGMKRYWIKGTDTVHMLTRFGRWDEDKLIHSPTRITRRDWAGITCMKALRLLGKHEEGGKKISHTGAVEIYWKNQWMILSDETWNFAEGNVFCHYLGYDRAVDVIPIDNAELKNQTVLAIDFRCRGNEGELTDCQYKENVTAQSSGKAGVGVRCTVEGEELCKACYCGQRTANCSNRNLYYMPWISPNYTTENVTEYLLHRNFIEMVEKFHFQEFTFLEKLDLSDNRLSNLPDDLFLYVSGLKFLNLSGNRIQTIHADLLKNLKSLKEFDLSDNRLSNLPDDLFLYVSGLKFLNLSGNRIQTIDVDLLKNLKYLEELDISRNNIYKFNVNVLDYLTNLKRLHTDKFTICCYARKKIPDIYCRSPEDIFSSCEELLKNDFLEKFIWIVAVLIFLGNITVILIRVFLSEKGIQTWFIGSLLSSDTLMGVYLAIIAYNNRVYNGEYFEHDEQWRSSTSCTMAGAVSLLSSQVSLFTIAAIAMERHLSVIYALEGFEKFSKKVTILLVVASWSLGSIFAIIPAVSQHYFNSEFVKFYGQNSVCLPLQLRENDREVFGWEYCLALFGGVNTFICLYVTISYFAMCISLRKNNGEIDIVRRRENSYFAKRTTGIVLTNLCCWLPIIVFTFLSLGGFASRVRTLHAWSAVCLFPINAVLNPAIYTFFARSIRERMRSVFESTVTRANTVLRTGLL